MALTTSLSSSVVQTIIRDTLFLIPSIAPQSTFPEDQFASLGGSTVDFSPNSSIGMIISRIDGALSDDSSDDDVQSALGDDVVQSDLHDITVPLAQLTSNVYGMLRNNISVQADDLVEKITANLQALDARSPDQAAREDKLTFVNWGALNDPSVVIAITNVCYNEAKAFVPGQEIQKYYIDGCLAAASRFAPPAVSGSDNQAALAKSLEDFTATDDTPAPAAPSPNAYVATNNSVYLGLLTEVKNKIYAGGKSLVSAINRVNALYQDVQKYQTALSDSDTAPTSLVTGTSQLVIGVALLLGALQAARQTIYADTLFFGVDDDGTILVNSDNVPLYESKGYTCENLVTVFRFMQAKGYTISLRGVSLATALQLTDGAVTTEANNLADLAERADIETQQLFQKTITQVVGQWAAGFVASNTPTVTQEDIAKQLTLLPIQAVKTETPLGDLIMNFILFVYNNPALTAMDGFMREAIGGDRLCCDLDASVARTSALGQFIYWLIAQPKYLAS